MLKKGIFLVYQTKSNLMQFCVNIYLADLPIIFFLSSLNAAFIVNVPRKAKARVTDTATTKSRMVHT